MKMTLPMIRLMKNKWTMVFASVLIYAVMRTTLDSGFWLREFWFDEAYSGNIVRMSWAEMFAMIERDIHPPLYYVLLKVWGSALGFSDTALRSLSVALLLGLLVVVFLLVRTITKNVPFALGSMVVFASNPYIIQYAQEARMYMLLTVMVLIASLFFWQAITKTPQRFSWYWMGFCASIIGALYTHYTAIFALCGFGVFTFIMTISKKKYLWRKTVLLWSLVGGVLVMGILPWLPIFLEHINKKDNLGWNAAPVWQDIFVYAHVFFFGTSQGATGELSAHSFVFPLPVLASGVMLVCLCAGLLLRSQYLHKKKRLAFAFCCTMIAVMISGFVGAELLGVHLIHSRYLFVVTPFLLLAVIMLMQTFAKKTVVIILSCYLIATLLLVPQDHSDASSFRRLATAIEQQAPEAIVYHEPFVYLVTRFYVGEKHRHILFDDNEQYGHWAVIPPGERITQRTELPEQYSIVTTETVIEPHWQWQEQVGDLQIYRVANIVEKEIEEK